MPNPLWTYTVKLQGSTARNRTSINFVLQYDDADPQMTLAEAQNAANQIRGALVDITDAFVQQETLHYLVSADNQLPAGNIDCMDEAVVMCHLNAPGDLPKLYPLRVPAPAADLFLADGETVDIGEALLIQYVQQVSQHAFVSDNEQINTSAGQNGIDRGHKRSRAKSYVKG